jgi:O-antigen ligase
MFAWLAFQALRNERRALTAARLTVIGLSILAFYGLISTDNPNLLFYEKISYDGFATGPFVNRNSFATLLAMGATLSLALAITPQDQSTRRSRTQSNPLKIDRVIGQALAFSPVLLFLSCALLTGSRMGLFVTFLGMGLVVLLGGRLSSVSRVKVMALGALLAIILIVVFTLSFGQLTFDRLGSTGASADVRGNLYITIINMIKEAPILGHGFDSFTQSYRLFHTAPVSADLRWDQAHNTYLELWAELGLLVGSIPPLICLLAGVNLYRRAIVSNSKAAPLACAGFASIFACAIHSLVDFSLEMPTNVYLLIFITAMGLAPQAKSRIGA